MKHARPREEKTGPRRRHECIRTSRAIDRRLFSYIRSFIRIRDERVDALVTSCLDQAPVAGSSDPAQSVLSVRSTIDDLWPGSPACGMRQVFRAGKDKTRQDASTLPAQTMRFAGRGLAGTTSYNCTGSARAGVHRPSLIACIAPRKRTRIQQSSFTR